MRSTLLAILAAASLCAGPARAESGDLATAFALADIAPAASASIQGATRLLFGTTPGVLTTRIPGGGVVSLTAAGVDPSTGVYTFTAEAAGAADLQALMEGVSAAASASSRGLALEGVINGQAVQLVVLSAQPGPDGAGLLKLLLAFD